MKHLKKLFPDTNFNTTNAGHVRETPDVWQP